jgi:hypothetical protein
MSADTAIFSVVNAVLLKPAPFPDAGRLVLFMNTSPQGSGPASSPAKFAHWRQQTTVIQDAAAFRTNVVNYTGGQFPEQLRAGQVSADYFRLFGARVEQGRTFSPEEDLPGGAKVVVLSHGLWTRRFGSDPSIIGKTIALSGDPHVVIGIIGPEFDTAEFGEPPELWVPFNWTRTPSIRSLPGGGAPQAGHPARAGASATEAVGRRVQRKFPNALQGRQQSFSVGRFSRCLCVTRGRRS